MKNKQKLVIIVLFSLSLCLLTGCLGVFIQDSLLDADKQIELFVENKHEWSDVDGEFYFTVTDINQDGKWELIVDFIQGSGNFAYNDYFVADGTGAVTKLDKEGRFGAYLSSYYDSEEGLISVPIYFDDDNNVYYSIQGTGYQDDPDTFVYSLESLWLKDNKLEEETLAYKICKESKEEGIVITYKDAQGNELTESYVFLVQKFSMA